VGLSQLSGEFIPVHGPAEPHTGDYFGGTG
jgi:hypothetical protein